MSAPRLIYEFEGFRLDTHTQSLHAPGDGQAIALKPKEFDTLLYFVRHAGELISKETLMTALWPGLVVEENNLNQYVTALRKLLGEERGGRRFIMNVRARGYRFVPPVLPLRADHGVKPAGAGSAKAPTENPIAWQCYQQAVHRQHTDNPERWSEAVALFEKAVALDPAFAGAYAYLALTRIRLYMLDHPSAFGAMERAREEARLAVQLDPGVADGHMALGAINATAGRWVEAELNYLAACALDSDWVMTSTMHSAHLLLSAGHLQRALVIGRDSLKNLNGVTSLAALHVAACVLAGADAEARQAVELAIAMGADLTFSPMCDALAMLARRDGRFDAAAAALVAALTPYLREAGAAEVIRQVFAAIADPAHAAQAQHTLDAFVRQLDFSKVPQSMRRQILLWYTEIGALDAAFTLAFRAMDFYEKYGIVGTAWGSLWLPEMAPFRRDPRFMEFARRMRLPDYWTAFGPPDGHLWQGDRLVVL